uniref:LITAF domain-containing protein n=1 Tax=Zooxanthella nutricula TaxID=1333877 RepID=A0A7S2PQ32_9DINO
MAPVPVPKTAEKPSNSLIEFSTVAGEDPNEHIIFGDAPAHCKCPHCDRSVVTFIDYEASWVTWLLAFVVWISLGWMAFWVLPLLWPAFKDVVHHCPRCLNVIERKSRINLPTFRSEVMTCKIGGCAVVLARKYVAILLGLVGIIGAVYFLRSTVQINTTHEEHKGAPSMLTWEDFLFDCGPRTSASLSHRPSTARAFEERFRRRTFKWQGEVAVIREGFEVLMVVRTKSVMMVKMYPPRFKTRQGDHPDIALLFGEDRNKEVASLSQGDWIEFEATMSAHGYRGDPEVMTLWHVAKAERPSPLSSSAGAAQHHTPDVEAGNASETHAARANSTDAGPAAHR